MAKSQTETPPRPDMQDADAKETIDFDQVNAELEQMAEQVAVYFRALIHRKFTRDEALALTLSFQSFLLTPSFEGNEVLDLGDLMGLDQLPEGFAGLGGHLAIDDEETP